MDFEHKLPAWSNEGIEPSDELKVGGFAGGYKPPATVFNYWWNKTSNAMNEVQEALADPDNHGAARKGLSNVEDSVFAQKALVAGVGGAIVVDATSTDGVAYSATVSGISALSVGFELTIIPSMTSTSRTPTFNLNGLGAIRISLPVNGSNTSMLTMPPIVYNDDTSQEEIDKKVSQASKWLTGGKPVTIRYEGSKWETTDIFAQSAQNLYGVVPIEIGGTNAKTAVKAVENLGIKRYVVDCGVNGNWDYEIYNDGTIIAHTNRTLSSWTNDTAKKIYIGTLTIEDFPYYMDTSSSIYTYATPDTPVMMGCTATVTSLYSANPMANTYFELTAICPSTYNIITTITQSMNINVYVKGKAILDAASITNNLTNVTTSNSKTVSMLGVSYSATLSCESTYVIDSVTVTMGGEDITSTAYSNKVITIDNVTGDIVITASATKTAGVVTYNLTNVSKSGGTSTVDYGSSFTTTLTADTGYTLSTVTVTMGGSDITSTAYSNGVVTIDNVTGDIVITATATEVLATKKYQVTGLTPTTITVSYNSIGTTFPYIIYNANKHTMSYSPTSNTDSTPAGFESHSNQWSGILMASDDTSPVIYYGNLTVSGVEGAYTGYGYRYYISSLASGTKTLVSGWTNSGTTLSGTYEFASGGNIYYYE